MKARTVTLRDDFGHDEHGFWHGAYHRHAPVVLAFLRGRTRGREEAEDLLQETFVRAMRAGTFRRGGNARAYLLSTARHLLINRFRRPRLVVPAEADEAGNDPLDLAPAKVASPEQDAAWQGFRERLDGVLGEMSEAHRTAFELGIFEGRSYAEIAELTGWTLSQVKVNVFRARKRVVRDLGDALPLTGGSS